MRPPSFSILSLLFLAGLANVLAAPASSGCFASPDKSQNLSLEIAPGEKREIYTTYYKGEGNDGNCSASIQVSLSNFPSSRLATRPKDIAIVIREVVDLWELDHCTVRVWYDNDTDEEFAEHELCLSEEFRFDSGAFWSASSERYCWEPIENDTAIDEDYEPQYEEEVVDEAPLETLEISLEQLA